MESNTHANNMKLNVYATDDRQFFKLIKTFRPKVDLYLTAWQANFKFQTKYQNCMAKSAGRERVQGHITIKRAVLIPPTFTQQFHAFTHFCRCRRPLCRHLPDSGPRSSVVELGCRPHPVPVLHRPLPGHELFPIPAKRARPANRRPTLGSAENWKKGVRFGLNAKFWTWSRETEKTAVGGGMIFGVK